jgi:hypothetical protein
MTERRKYKRPSLIGLVEIRKEMGNPPLEAYAINISYGGLAVYIKNPLTGKVYVTLYFGDGTGKKLDETIIAKVVWQEKTGSWYALGLRFEELNLQDHSMILGFLKSSEEREKRAHP